MSLATANTVFIGAAVLGGITTITTGYQAYTSVVPNTSFIGLDQFPIGAGTPVNIAYDGDGTIYGTITYFT